MQKLIPTTDDCICPLLPPIVILKCLVFGTLYLAAVVTDTLSQ